GRNFHRYLIARTPNAPLFDFQAGSHILQRLVYNFERINRVRAFARFIDRAVNNPFRQRFFAALHHRGNQTRHRSTAVARVYLLFLFVNLAPARHDYFFASAFGARALASPPPPALGRFAPYLERLRRRPSTPRESSVPRTI